LYFCCSSFPDLLPADHNGAPSPQSVSGDRNICWSLRGALCSAKRKSDYMTCRLGGRTGCGRGTKPRGCRPYPISRSVWVIARPEPQRAMRFWGVCADWEWLCARDRGTTLGRLRAASWIEAALGGALGILIMQRGDAGSASDDRCVRVRAECETECWNDDTKVPKYKGSDTFSALRHKPPFVCPILTYSYAAAWTKLRLSFH
jgi:hypothetical protein